jgi:hypothetical protein
MMIISIDACVVAATFSNWVQHRFVLMIYASMDCYTLDDSFDCGCNLRNLFDDKQNNLMGRDRFWMPRIHPCLLGSI